MPLLRAGMETRLSQGHVASRGEDATGQLCPWPSSKERSHQIHSTQSSETGFGDQELQLRLMTALGMGSQSRVDSPPLVW